MNNLKNDEMRYLIQSLKLDIEILKQRKKEKKDLLEYLKFIEECSTDIH